MEKHQEKEGFAMEKRYIVTGANGHLGHTIVSMLADAGACVRALVYDGDAQGVPMPQQVERVAGDVRDYASLEALFAQDDAHENIVIHTAGIVKIASKVDENVYAVNVQGTKNIIRGCMENHVKRLVYVSSVHAIAEKRKGEKIEETKEFNPKRVVGAYAKTKAEATKAVLDSVAQGLDAVVVHPSGILGPGDYGHGHLTQMVIDACRGALRACVKGGYDFVDVRDVAYGTIQAAEKGRKGECYILSNRYYPVPAFLNLLHTVCGYRAIKLVLTFWLAKATAPLSEWYYKLRKQPPLYTRYSLYTLQSNGWFDHSKATKELDYHPRPMEETMADTVEFLQKQGRIPLPKGKECRCN